MKTENLYTYHRFSWNWTISFHRANSPINDVISTLKLTLKTMDELELKVSKLVLEKDLLAFIEKLKKLDQKTNLGKELALELNTLLMGIDKTLDAELRLRFAYRLTEKRLGLTNLLSNVDQIFEANMFKKLPEFSQNDFIDAGKCIAFERYTGGAFHILRATEEVLREYYKFKIKRNRKKLLLWNPMLEDLEKKNNVPKGLIALLDNIREEFRNPTAHPEKNYGVDDVQTLFSECINIVSRMIKDMKK